MSRIIKKSKTQNELLDGVREYGLLKQQLNKAGIFERAYTYYYLFIAIVFGGFFLSIYALAVLKSIPLLILFGLVFTFFSVQIAGLLHDAGHRAIFKSTKMNDFFGHICGIVLAMGYSSWKIKHNLHHAHPNQEGEDPDVELPLLSFTKERFIAKTRLAKLLRRYQVFFYFPLGVLVVFSTRITSIRFFIKHFEKKKIIEIVGMALALFAWYVVPFLAFDFSKAMLIVLVVNLSTGFYLFNVFAPNHKGMPHFAKNVKVSFLEQQIMTARNIYGNFFTDLLYMGLNYQIEHHLFPNTPRNKLKRITPYVTAICKKRNLEFTRTSILESNRIILSELHQTAL